MKREKHAKFLTLLKTNHIEITHRRLLKYIHSNQKLRLVQRSQPKCQAFITTALATVELLLYCECKNMLEQLSRVHAVETTT